MVSMQQAMSERFKQLFILHYDTGNNWYRGRAGAMSFVHQPIFPVASGGGGCIVCHSNHAIHQPSTAMLAGPKAVCSQCHEAWQSRPDDGA